MSGRSITSFLLAVRRRLWLDAALRRLRTAVWAASAALALFALAHVAWQPVSPMVATIGAVVVGLIVLLPALLSRPLLTECALRADRHFDGRALLTTATEFGASERLRPAETTVMRRALAACAAWRSRLGELWHAPPRSGYVLALVPAFFAALLLQVPTGEEFIVDTGSENAVGPAGRILAEPGDTDDLAAMREAIMQEAANSERRSERGPATGVAQLADDEPQPRADRVEINELATGQPGVAGTSDQAGVTPGDARRRPVDGDREPDAVMPNLERVTATSIARHGATAAGRNETNEAYATALAGSDATRLSIAPVPAPPAVSSWTTLTAAEIAYARRYLDLKDQDNE